MWAELESLLPAQPLWTFLMARLSPAWPTACQHFIFKPGSDLRLTLPLPLLFPARCVQSTRTFLGNREGWEQCQGRCTPAVQGRKSPMPIKTGPGDSFALGLGRMLLVHSYMLCKCYNLHSWLAAHVCSQWLAGWEPVGSSLEGRVLPRGGLGLCTPLTLISAYPGVWLCGCNQNGRLYSSSKDGSSTWKFHVVAGSSANELTQTFPDNTGTVCWEPSKCLMWYWMLRLGICSRSHSCYIAEFGFIHVYLSLISILSHTVGLTLFVSKKKKKS